MRFSLPRFSMTRFSSACSRQGPASAVELSRLGSQRVDLVADPAIGGHALGFNGMEAIITASAGRPRRWRPGSPPVLSAGDVVAVAGELGAGKTTFVRGACRALGVTAPVTSPTFTIGHRYEGRVPVAHLDLYRLDGLGAEEWADLEPYFDGTIAFVEWPEHAGGWLPPAARRVTLAHVDEATGASGSTVKTIFAFDTATTTAVCALVRDGELARRAPGRGPLGARGRRRAARDGRPRARRTSTRSSSAPGPGASPRSGSASRRRAVSRSALGIPAAGVSTLHAFAGGRP